MSRSGSTAYSSRLRTISEVLWKGERAGGRARAIQGCAEGFMSGGEHCPGAGAHKQLERHKKRDVPPTILFMLCNPSGTPPRTTWFEYGGGSHRSNFFYGQGKRGRSFCEKEEIHQLEGHGARARSAARCPPSAVPTCLMGALGGCAVAACGGVRLGAGSGSLRGGLSAFRWGRKQGFLQSQCPEVTCTAREKRAHHPRP